MIRVNLLTSKITSVGGVAQGITFDTSGGAEERKENIKKVLYIMLFTILLYMYESYNLSSLTDELNRLKREDNKLQNEIVVLKKEAGRAPEVEREVKKMEEKLKIVTQLSKKRLRELKALDFLQNIIPDGVWLKSLKYDGKKINFEGGATSDDDMNKFVESLDKSTQFEEVVLVKAVERSTPNGVIKEFVVNSKLGDVD